MKTTLHAEWTKLRTVPGNAWLVVVAVVLTAGLSALASVAVSCSSPGCNQDPTKISLTGVGLGQAMVAILAVVIISDEYGTGMIRATFTAVPRRSAVLAAKATILTVVVLAAASISVLASIVAGRIALPRSGFTAAHGFAALSLTHGSTLRAAFGSVLYLALVGLLSLGIATVVRDSAVAVGAVLGLLYLFPILAALVTDPDWQRHVRQIGPMNAGLAIQATTNLRDLPIAPWAGLGVLAAWAAAALLGAGVVLRVRDA